MAPAKSREAYAGISALVVEDHDGVREFLCETLATMSLSVRSAPDAETAVELAAQETPDLLVTDLGLPGMDGLSLVRTLRKTCPDLPVIIITGQATVQNAITALRLGVCDYLTKPVDLTTLQERVSLVLTRSVLPHRGCRDEAGAEFLEVGGGQVLVSRSASMRRLLATVRSAAQTQSTVLIQGESGTGKELLARSLHALGRAPERPFVPVDCASLSPTLCESQLFGHVKGAFTGADKDSLGLFRTADKGTLFLDEIGELSPPLQSKLLRAMQQREVVPIGSSTPEPVDVRFVAATNRNLEKALKSGALRQDLFYRISVVPLYIPPLRERREDIPLLCGYFLGRAAHETNRKDKVLTPETEACLARYDWPGNVRELRNLVEWMYATLPEATVGLRQLPPKLRASAQAAQEPSAERIPTLDEAERDLIGRALVVTEGNRSRAAKILGVERARFYRKLKKHHLD